MSRVGRRQLAKLVSGRADVSAAVAHRVLTQAFEAIAEEMAKGNSVTITGFGSWRTKVYMPRTGKNPRDGKPIKIPARTRVVFRAGSKLRQAVESSVDPEVFFGDGVAPSSEIEAVLAKLFGADPATSHLEDAVERIRAVLSPGAEQEAEEFFETLCVKEVEVVEDDGKKATKPDEDAPAEVGRVQQTPDEADQPPENAEPSPRTRT